MLEINKNQDCLIQLAGHSCNKHWCRCCFCPYSKNTLVHLFSYSFFGDKNYVASIFNRFNVPSIK